MKTSIMKKNRMVLPLPLVLVFSGMSFATGGDLGGTAYDGSEAAPYQISDADDLKAFASIVNGGEYSANAVLTADICLNACGEGESVLKADGTLNGSGFEQWKPIGTESNLFAGTFEGNSHAIRGLYINDKDKDYAALFGDVASTAKIQNVGVVDSYIKGKAWVGSIAGVNEGSISNVYNTGFVSGDGNYVGGVVGYNKKGSASNAYNIGSVSGTGKYVGGLIGYNSGTVSNAYNAGSVIGSSSYVGGVVGYNKNGSISNVYNTGSVSGSSSYVGGVVGYNINASVSNSYYNTDFFSESNGYGEGKTSAELAALNVATAFLSETGVWSAGDADGDIIKLPYLTSFGETSQPQVAHVTFFDDGEAFVKKIAVQVGSKIPLAEVPTLDKAPTLDELEFFGWYGNVSDESTKWSFENGVVTKNISLKAMAIGVVGDVYQIANVVNLRAFASIVNGGEKSANAVLTADICLNACGEGESVLKADGTLNGSGFEQWTPIGAESNPFAGTFEGNSHAIRGLYINDDTKNYVGLFGYAVSDAIIQNVGVVDSYVKGNSYVGGVVGINYGSVSGAYNMGSVSGSSSYVGGVVGINYGSVSGAYNMGSVSGSSSYVGGVVGYNDKGTVSNAYSTGSVSGNSDYVGGVVGRNYYGTVSNAYSTGSVSGSGNYVGGVVGDNYKGTVSNAYSTGSVSGSSNYVGGVVGINYGSVSGAYNMGSVSGSSNYVGGVVGYNNGGNVSNAYSTGSVSGAFCVGGVVGYNYYGTVSNVYNTGSVNGTGGYVGGVVGYNVGTVSYGYYNITTCPACEGAINGSDDIANSVVGKTSAELAALNVATAFPVEEGVESPWTAGSVENGDGYVTYKLPYFVVFGAASQPTISPAIEFAAGNASATVYGATTGSVNIASDIEVSGTITFKRSFPNLSADNAFSTIMLPFTPISVPEGVTFYEFVGASENGGKWTVSVSEATEIAANTPYLVKVAGGAESIEFAGGTFKATEGEHGVTQGNWKFVGTYEYKQWLEGNAGLGKTYGFVGAAGNAATEVGKFKKAGAGAYIFPMRAYLEYSASAGRPAANGAKPAVASLPDEIGVVIVDKDETTGEETTRVIGTLDTRTGEFKFATDRWFDLNGRYLGNKKPTQKGAYYNNGKKVIVK